MNEGTDHFTFALDVTKFAICMLLLKCGLSCNLKAWSYMLFCFKVSLWCLTEIKPVSCCIHTADTFDVKSDFKPHINAFKIRFAKAGDCTFTLQMQTNVFVFCHHRPEIKFKKQVKPTVV